LKDLVIDFLGSSITICLFGCGLLMTICLGNILVGEARHTSTFILVFFASVLIRNICRSAQIFTNQVRSNHEVGIIDSRNDTQYN